MATTVSHTFAPDLSPIAIRNFSKERYLSPEWLERERTDLWATSWLVAGVAEAPSYLSGLTDEQAKAIRTQYERAHGGDLPARAEALAKAIEINRKTAMQALQFQSALLPMERAREIEAKQQAARRMREKLGAYVSAGGFLKVSAKRGGARYLFRGRAPYTLPRNYQRKPGIVTPDRLLQNAQNPQDNHDDDDRHDKTEYASGVHLFTPILPVR